MMELTTKLKAIAAQENNDSEEYDLMVDAANEIKKLREELELVRRTGMTLAGDWYEEKTKNKALEQENERLRKIIEDNELGVWVEGR